MNIRFAVALLSSCVCLSGYGMEEYMPLSDVAQRAAFEEPPVGFFGNPHGPFSSFEDDREDNREITRILSGSPASVQPISRSSSYDIAAPSRASSNSVNDEMGRSPLVPTISPLMSDEQAALGTWLYEYVNDKRSGTGTRVVAACIAIKNAQRNQLIAHDIVVDIVEQALQLS